jgi:KaiC/GvpD/RAD55 family RecA-like ATPase
MNGAVPRVISESTDPHMIRISLVGNLLGIETSTCVGHQLFHHLEWVFDHVPALRRLPDGRGCYPEKSLRRDTLINRSAGLGMDLQTHLARGHLALRTIDPLELTPGKFADMVRMAVDDGATMIVVDSLTGYVASMGAATDVALQIRNLLSFLAQRNVTTLLVSIQHGLLGSEDEPSAAMSYLADTVILLRFYEYFGEVRRALSVFKKRRGAHERTIRDIGFSSKGIEIGQPLRQFRGILTGVPEFQPGSE